MSQRTRLPLANTVIVLADKTDSALAESMNSPVSNVSRHLFNW